MRRLPLLVLLPLLAAAPSVGQVLPDGLTSGLDFRMVGPSRGGRVTAVAGHRATPGTFFMGATGGGVWKTSDFGQSWTNVSDGYFHTGSIGSIDVADSDPDVVYVGTGSDGTRSNVIIGRGIHRSNDGGATWLDLGLKDAGQIGAVVVHPTNPEVAWVAALGSPFGPGPQRGVYRTVDGGTSWQRMHFVSEATGAVDLELKPGDPNTIYASFWHTRRDPWTIVSGDDRESGIYKSSDGGTTWRKLTAGLPKGLVGKSDLAVSPADPSRVYALVETVPAEEGLYRSNDEGETWQLVSNEPGLMRRPFYYTNVDADPTNADVVWVNNEAFFRSEDGGRTWQRRSTPHGDNHDMWINPDDPDLMIQSNDGGANVTRDGGRTWSTQENQATAELYQVHLDDRFPWYLYAGQQDNSTIAVPYLPDVPRPAGANAWWEEIGGCETGPVVPKPGDPNVVYANCKGLFSVYDRRTGQERNYAVGASDLYGANPKDLVYRFQRVVPIEVSPHDPNIVYHGSQYVHRTTDGGVTWERISPDLTAFRPERQVYSGSPITRDITGEEHFSVLYVIEESPLEPGVIWAGSNDGPVHVTRDGGATWNAVTPPMPPEGRVNQIDVSPHRPGTAFVAANRVYLDDFRPYAFRTDDYGRTWTLMTDGTNGIAPDEPVRVVREDPVRPGLLYAGTDYGLYISLDSGSHWRSLEGDFPVVQVSDLKVRGSDLAISTMGRGFWVLDDVSWLRQWTAEAAGVPVHLFTPREAVRVRHSGSRGSNGSPEYPAAGASIWYRLASDVESVRLEILESAGVVVRSYEATARVEGASRRPNAAPDQGMRGPVQAAPPSTGLSTEAGLHRFSWDFRTTGAVGAGGRTGAGPAVPPGTYTVRLTADGTVLEAPLAVVADPRVLASGVTLEDIEGQFVHNLAVRDQVSRFQRGLGRLDEGLKALGEPVGEETSALGAKREILKALRAEAVTDNSDSYPPRRMDAQWSHLAGQTSGADQAVGRDARERLVELTHRLDDWLARVDAALAGP